MDVDVEFVGCQSILPAFGGWGSGGGGVGGWEYGWAPKVLQKLWILKPSFFWGGCIVIPSALSNATGMV